MKTILIIQARMGSSRLPGKILMSLGEMLNLDYVVGRCRRIEGLLDVVVATSNLPQDDAVEVWCAERGVTCFRGSEDDVLSRYMKAAAPYDPDYVMRVTGDCPFIDYELGTAMVRAARAEPCDIIRLEGPLPRGLEPQLVSYQALKYMDAHGREDRHREHVAYYAYEFPDLFKAVYVSIPAHLRHPELRITLDTNEDYDMLRAVAGHFGARIDMTSTEIVDYLLAHPEISAINAHVEQKPVV
ncbi:glycosyltransferase family protein [Cohnella ginsengisoli]|uniref:Glycosyltransferase family protein n=1 Tax=Cohnella ginsengisoli TaxID=425004 RepID=A0A9X4QQ52_9BACL|nr:glycosyltransferase family protein [Cohnella ginsengisoli]MDG0794583.1 glycosyltransferase family protein [Cohnella ginsengisoli]